MPSTITLPTALDLNPIADAVRIVLLTAHGVCLLRLRLATETLTRAEQSQQAIEQATLGATAAEDKLAHHPVAYAPPAHVTARRWADRDCRRARDTAVDVAGTVSR